MKTKLMQLAILVLTLAFTLTLSRDAQSTSYLTAPALSSYDVTTSGFTVEAWVKVRSKPGFDPRIVMADNGCNCGIENWSLFVCHLSGGQCSSPGDVGFGFADNGVGYEIVSSVSIDDGQFHHVAATYDGNTMRIYIDGTLRASKPVGARQVNVGGGPIVIGNMTGFNNDFDGRIDEFRIWNVARSQTDIQNNMSVEISPSSSGLVAYWRLNGSYSDLTSSGNTLTPGGNVSFQTGQLGQAADIVNPDGSSVPALGTRGVLLWLGLAGLGAWLMNRRASRRRSDES